MVVLTCDLLLCDTMHKHATCWCLSVCLSVCHICVLYPNRWTYSQWWRIQVKVRDGIPALTSFGVSFYLCIHLWRRTTKFEDVKTHMGRGLVSCFYVGQPVLTNFGVLHYLCLHTLSRTTTFVKLTRGGGGVCFLGSATYASHSKGTEPQRSSVLGVRFYLCLHPSA